MPLVPYASYVCLFFAGDRRRNIQPRPAFHYIRFFTGKRVGLFYRRFRYFSAPCIYLNLINGNSVQIDSKRVLICFLTFQVSYGEFDYRFGMAGNILVAVCFVLAHDIIVETYLNISVGTTASAIRIDIRVAYGNQVEMLFVGE